MCRQLVQVHISCEETKIFTSIPCKEGVKRTTKFTSDNKFINWSHLPLWIFRRVLLQICNYLYASSCADRSSVCDFLASLEFWVRRHFPELLWLVTAAIRYLELLNWSLRFTAIVITVLQKLLSPVQLHGLWQIVSWRSIDFTIWKRSTHALLIEFGGLLLLSYLLQWIF